MTDKSKNIYLFYGSDDFSLKRKVDRWKEEFAKKYSTNSISILDSESLSEIELIKKLKNELAPSLFSDKKLLILRNILPRKADSSVAEFLLELIPQIPKDYFLIFQEFAKPDGRLGFTKKFVSLVNVTQFDLPHGIQLNAWIKAMAKTMAVSISDPAAEKLAEFLGRDLFEEKKAGGKVFERHESFDLWQVNSELQKLASKTSQIEVKDVLDLVKAKLPDSVFALTDEIVAKDQKNTYQALENFLAGQTLDEKSAFVKIIGLLSEQFRSLFLVSLLSKQGLSNDQIAEKLGWSTGRVFITAKNARNVSQNKLKILLNQLLLIDTKIKSTDSNAKLLVDLFITKAVQ